MDADDAFTATRLSLHGVAEMLLAGPQHEASGTIKLRPLPGGFGTTRSPDLRVVGTAVVAADRRAEIDGRTAREVGDELGIDARDLSEVYHDGPGIGPDDVLRVDRAAAERIASAYATGDEALRRLVPGQVPILWPEHFDLGITVDATNYGASPGDSAFDDPYFYVGPHEGPTSMHDFWNAPFGAAAPAHRIPTTDHAVAFCWEGRNRIRIDRSTT